MTLTTATHARREFFDIIKAAANKHEIFHIQHREGNVVLMSEEEYDSLMETLHLLSSAEFKKSMQRSLKQMHKGETYSLDEVL